MEIERTFRSSMVEVFNLEIVKRPLSLVKHLIKGNPEIWGVKQASPLKVQKEGGIDIRTKSCIGPSIVDGNF